MTNCNMIEIYRRFGVRTALSSRQSRYCVTQGMEALGSSETPICTQRRLIFMVVWVRIPVVFSVRISSSPCVLHC